MTQVPINDAAAIVARVRADRVMQQAQSLGATVRLTTIVTVLESGSTIDLIKPQRIVHEAHGAYHRESGRGARIRIVAARGTAALSGLARGPIENYSTLGETVEIGEDRIILLNTSIVSPLARDADEYYAFEHAGVERRSGVEVDAIRIVPTARHWPLFEGRIYVAREVAGGGAGSGAVPAGSLVAMELQPSAATWIPFITTITILQTFAPTPAGDIVPDSLAITGSGIVSFAALGLAQTRVEFAVTSRLDDQRVGVPMPDSLRWQSLPIVIREDAGDAPSSFWASQSMLTSEQVSMIEATRVAAEEQARSPSFTFGAMVDYNRAGSATPTLSAGAAFGPVGASVSGGYSFGLERPIGEGSLRLDVGDPSSLSATMRASTFSQIASTTTGDRNYPRLMNTLVAATLHADYYDFFRKDGWNAGGDVRYGYVRLGATVEQSRQFSIGNNASWSLVTWTSKEFQPNPAITEGEFTTVQADLAFSRVEPFLKLTPVGEDDIRFLVTGMRGARTGADTTFGLVEALVSYSLPLAETGYNPISLTLLAAAGTGSASLPPQYQFRMRTSAATFGKPGGLVSPPKGLYGGTEYIALGAELNLTDLPWRAIGLPTADGRGIELLVAGAVARYRQAHPVGYVGTGDDWYSEVGVGLSRIPLFITDIVFGRVDLRQGLGPLGKFGGNFTFVLPL